MGKPLGKGRGRSHLTTPLPTFRPCWDKTQQEALDQLRLCLVEPPTLEYPDHNKEFILNIGASGKGLVAVLLQYQGGDLPIISYGSRSLTPAEKKYHSSGLELLGVKWAVCNQFRDYLYIMHKLPCLRRQ